VRSGQIDGLKNYEYRIIKFDGIGDEQTENPKGYGRIEYAYHLMAKDCGIIMSECNLLEESGRAHFMTKRFDRTGTEKLHMQTLCALAHFDYNNPTAYSYEQAFQVMRQLLLPYTDAVELFKRMTFNVIAMNRDDHTKNISFLMDKTGIWKLAPAYDVTYSYHPGNKWMMAHQMSVNGKRNEIKRSDLLSVAKNMNIKKPNEIIEHIVETVSKWKKYAKQAGVNTEQLKAIEKVLLIKI